MTDENIAIAIAVPVPQRLVNYGSVVLVAAKADISARRSDTPDGANGKDELDSRELRKSARREYHKCIERKRRCATFLLCSYCGGHLLFLNLTSVW